MKVLMLPTLEHFRSETNGIAQVVRAYHKYLPQFGVELVGPNQEYDLIAAHAGHGSSGVEVLHVHGLYWTADYAATAAEYETNKEIIEGIRIAKEITVPSKWVAEAFQRDMRFNPHVIGHGIEWENWQHNLKHQGYILWNKNRTSDVCNPEAVDKLAGIFPDVKFVSTFGIKSPNVITIGLTSHSVMSSYIKQAAIYLSTVKETFGIGTLEAMAAGVPILGWRNGGNIDLVQHGVNGYLAEPGNYEDLAEGLIYCAKYRDTLGENGREIAKGYTWYRVCEQLLQVYNLAMVEEPPSVSVIIPTFNKDVLEVSRAIDSCLKQTYQPQKIIVVDDGSESPYEWLQDGRYCDILIYVRQENQGVANARNNGIALARTKYICCLDADDAISPMFLELCVKELERDRSLGIAYTGLWQVFPTGEQELSQWPNEWVYDKDLTGQNQVPTCCVFRRRTWERLGGYRQRYAPRGAGEEDGEFWLRAGAYGWKAKIVEPHLDFIQLYHRLKKDLKRSPTKEEIVRNGIGELDYELVMSSLFKYSLLTGQVTGNKKHHITNYRAWHPWVTDSKYPFASYATPKRQSHEVRQYDEPIISVIIPVGPGHEKDVINALDSLEAQTFRKWEAVVIWDACPGPDEFVKVQDAYPYIRSKSTGDESPKGAGYARNRGVEIARAPFIFFLDADDTLAPTCLEDMLAGWNKHQTGIYSDYVAVAKIYDEKFLQEIKAQGRLQSYNSRTNEAVWSFRAPEFNCEKALVQPDENAIKNFPNVQPYQFNLVETLIPRVWHFEIGGFDEKMPTWEDWDYWLRLVRAGYCFTRIPQELVGYRFHTGTRRELAIPETEQGRQVAENMLQYMRRKFGDTKLMCGCKGKNNGGGSPAMAQQQVEAMSQSMTDENFVRATYRGSKGKSQVVGAARFEQQFPNFKMRRVGINPSQFVIDYGYIKDGDKALVHKSDVELMHCWNPLTEVTVPVMPRQELQEPQRITLPPISTDWQQVASGELPENFRQEFIRARKNYEREILGNPPLANNDLSNSEEVANIAKVLSRHREPLSFEAKETGLVGIAESLDNQFKPGLIVQVIPNNEVFTLQSLPGVNDAVAERLKAKGLDTPEKILEAGLDELMLIDGIAERRARAIIKYLSK